MGNNVNTWLVAAGIAVSPLPLAVFANTPCSLVDQEISDAYYTREGFRQPSRRAVVPAPKFCPTNASYQGRQYSGCGKSGFAAAALFYQSNYDYVDRLLGINELLYQTNADRFRPFLEPHFDSVSAQRNLPNRDAPYPRKPVLPHPFGQMPFAVVEDRKSKVVPTKEIRLPAYDKALVYYHRETGMVFSLTLYPRAKDSSADLLVLGFKGSEPFDYGKDFTRDNIPQELNLMTPKYEAAYQVSQAVQMLLRKAGRTCNTKMAYTGHSLGGGLALMAGALAGPRCDRRSDSIVVFNSATPSYENHRMQVRQNNAIALIVDFAIDNEVVAKLAPNKASILRYFSGSSQVLRFASIDSGADRRALKHFVNVLHVSGVPVATAAALAADTLLAAAESIENHVLKTVRKQVTLINRGMVPPPAFPTKASTDMLCRAYTPL